MPNEIKGSKVLVTGGAGLIGSHIVDALIKEDVGKVIVFDNFFRGKKENLEEALKSDRVELFEGDIRDRKALKKAFQGVDYVFHEAALPLLDSEQNPRECLDINIVGAFNVCEACVENKVKKLIAASSSSVYGEGQYLPTDEKHPFNNNLFYGASKVADEQLYRAFYKKYGLDYVAFRYLNVYGPRADFGKSAYVMVIMKFLDKIEAGESPVIQGDGSATLDLVYVEDVARANVMALKSNVTNEFFNVASGKETSIKELLEILLNLTGSKIKPIYEPRDSKLVVRRWGCAKKAKEMLGFETTTPVKDGLRKIIEWRKQALS